MSLSENGLGYAEASLFPVPDTAVSPGVFAGSACILITSRSALNGQTHAKSQHILYTYKQ